MAEIDEGSVIGNYRRIVQNGRTGGDRTRDPNIKSVVLYQLSYSPGRSKTAHIIPKTRRICNR